MAKAPITKRTVDASQPGDVEYIVWDDGGKETVKGFGLKVTPAGSKVYLYQYRLARPGMAEKTNPKKYTIGKHGNLTPDQARARAKELAAMVDRGVDPRQAELDAVAALDEAQRLADEQAKLDGELLFEKVAADWLADYEEHHRPSTVGQAKVSVNKYLAPKLSGKPMPSIKKADIQAVIDAIPVKQKATRQQVYAYASILWRWALQKDKVHDNPVPNMAKPPVPEKRNRVLTEDELAIVWKAALTLREPFGSFYRLLILTGQRREEVGGMDWAELNRANASWIIPEDRAKNGHAHYVPLAPAVIAELDSIAGLAHQKKKVDQKEAGAWPIYGPVISMSGKHTLSCFSQAKLELDEAIVKLSAGFQTISAWRVHDLRRTFATGLQKLGVRLEVTEAILNHISGSKAGVAGVYQLYDWADEKAEALATWAATVFALAKGHRPDQFRSGTGKADILAWRQFIAACAANHGRPIDK